MEDYACTEGIVEDVGGWMLGAVRPEGAAAPGAPTATVQRTKETRRGHPARG